MNLPARPDQGRHPAPAAPSGTPEPSVATGMTIFDVWAILTRRWRWVAAVTVVGIAGAVALVRSGVPMYEGVATLRFEDPQVGIPDVFGGASAASHVATEIEELRSRSLAESAARALGLRLQVVEPADAPRTSIVREAWVADDVESVSYLLVRRSDSVFTVMIAGRDSTIGQVARGQVFSGNDVRFTLDSAATAHARILLRAVSLASATSAVRSGLSVSRAGRDASIVTLRYRTPDPELAWKVPNAIAVEFTGRRRELQESGVASTIAFLREQLDSVSRQLATSENALRRFREVERAISPQVEASTQVHRVVALEAERGAVEAERAALARLVSEVDAAAGSRRAADPSPYRRLLAFPTLMRHSGMGNVLGSLTSLETERNELLTRRTEADPDVQALTGRIEQLEGQIRVTAGTYLQGLEDQVSAMDANLRGFNRTLAQLPRREVEYARLERTPKVLEGIYTMLQTRLKEAEIAHAASDRTVRVVDQAVPPLGPARSRRNMVALAIVFAAVLAGLALAFLRELTDAALHTRAEAQLVTGLPVLGLIPRIRGTRGRVARIGRRAALSARAESRRRSPAVPADTGPTYTFFGAAPPPPMRQANGNGHRTETALATLPSHLVAVEAYGVLQTNITFTRPDDPVRTLVMTSAMPGEGKTTTAVNLAITLALRGLRVLLIDTDLRQGRVHVALETERAPGLSDFLQGTRSWNDILRVAVVDERRELHYVACGSPAQSPTGMLESPALRTMLARLRAEYDTIILDSPPANLVTDAALLGAAADGVLVVARAGVTDAEALGHAVNALRHVGAPVLGVVLNDIDFRRESRYDRAYRFYDTSAYLGASDGAS